MRRQIPLPHARRRRVLSLAHMPSRKICLFALFTATAFGVLAAQALVFAVWWPFGHQSPFIFEPARAFRVSAVMDGTQRIPVLASLTGWLLPSGIIWWLCTIWPMVRSISTIFAR